MKGMGSEETGETSKEHIGSIHVKKDSDTDSKVFNAYDESSQSRKVNNYLGDENGHHAHG